ncbi:MAG: two-component sensor histidine kinase [Rhizobacter sp.]|nr:two-component sensor histidine kinase [Ferruginibacter sp.]
MDSAFYYSLQALNGLATLNNPKSLLDAYELLSQLYRENKQFDSAYKYLQHFVVLKDSLHNFSKIAEAQNFAFNQTLTDQQVAQGKKEAEQQLKNKIRLYVLAGVIAFILLATFLLMRNLRNKRRANIVLTQQKEEIQTSLAALKETQAQLIQSEKMASLGELTAGIAHEIQNPLNFVNNFSEVSGELIDEMNTALDEGNIKEAKGLSVDLKQNLEKISHHGKRADAIVKGMLQHSQSSIGKKEPTDINKLADEYLRLAYHGLRAKDKNFNATLKTAFDESIGNINIIPQDIGRVLLNLLTNAFYAVNEKKKTAGTDYEPTVSISTERSPLPGREPVPAFRDVRGELLIKVSDNGHGIPPHITDKIFQPFFTTKPTGQGTGLGLSLAYDIIKAHGGELKVETTGAEARPDDPLERGTTFTIVLPVNN